MRFTLVVLLILISIKANSQQNLFNIPSGDITEKGKVFYQHQINIYQSKFESKGHFVYGLGKGWDIGANLVGKGMGFHPSWQVIYNDDPRQGALSPHLMPTVQKQFNVFENFDINLGTQVGINLADRFSEKELAFFNYGIGVFYFMDKKSRIVGGLYHTNGMYVGPGNITGILLGYEVKISNKFYLMGDWLSGNNDSSAGVIGGMYNIGKRVQVCAGVLVPNPNNSKPPGLVLELNLLGWDLK